MEEQQRLGTTQRCLYAVTVRYFVWTYLLWSGVCVGLLYVDVLPADLVTWLWVLVALGLSIFRAYKVTCDRRRRTRELFLQFSALEMMNRVYIQMLYSSHSDLSLEEPTTVETVMSLPHVPASSSEPCAICLDSLDKVVTQLPCGHQFHSSCVDYWLQAKPKCPVCRRNVAE